MRSVAFVAVLAVLAGCSREDQTPTPLSRDRTTESAPAPETGTTAQVPTPAGGGSTPPAQEHTGILEAPGAYIEAAVGAKFDSQRKLWLTDLRQRIAAFEVIQDRKPASLEEIASQAPLPTLPANQEWKYDPRTGEIDIVDKR